MHHLEFLALKWSVTNKFSDYLRHSHCVVYTDNSPLTYILDKVKIDPCTQRWCSQLANYSLTVRYKRGRDNGVADIMSRLKTNEENNTDLVRKWCEGIDDRSKHVDCCVNDTVVKQILQNDMCNCQSGLVTNIHILDSGIALVNKRRFNFLESNMFCFCDSTILSCLV